MSVQLPHQSDGIFLAFTGTETEIIFRHGVDLPAFASFPLLETAAGRAVLDAVYRDQMHAAHGSGFATILESPTWVASPARARPLGYDMQALQRANIAAVDFVAHLRDSLQEPDTIIGANLGPMSDAYGPAAHHDADFYQTYHAQQIAWFAQTAVDMVTAYTIGHIPEAIGIIRAAKAAQIPIVMSFTVETDGRLPEGTTLAAAITQVDNETEGYAAYFMVNCAHPDHLDPVIAGIARLRGLVANASRCSHEELDNATELDDGDPQELAAQLADWRRRAPQINVLGGCCGTGAQHLREIARALSA